MITIPFSEFSKGRMALIDLETVPLRMRSDYKRRNDNLLAGRKLCGRCDGTGNELYASYRKCGDCWGAGYVNDEEPPRRTGFSYN